MPADDPAEAGVTHQMSMKIDGDACNAESVEARRRSTAECEQKPRRINFADGLRYLSGARDDRNADANEHQKDRNDWREDFS